MAPTQVRVPVVLFDWGETLMWIPGMIHNPDRHLACVEQVYASAVRPHMGIAGADMPAATFLEFYLKACRIQIRHSKETQREHSFDARFALAFDLAGIKSSPPPAAFAAMADALGNAVAQGARLLDHAAEVIEQLAQ